MKRVFKNIKNIIKGRKFAGEDIHGNQYYIINDSSNGKERRVVESGSKETSINGTDIPDLKMIPTEWDLWLKFISKYPPTDEVSQRLQTRLSDKRRTVKENYEEQDRIAIQQHLAGTGMGKSFRNETASFPETKTYIPYTPQQLGHTNVDDINYEAKNSNNDPEKPRARPSFDYIAKKMKENSSKPEQLPDTSSNTKDGEIATQANNIVSKRSQIWEEQMAKEDDDEEFNVDDHKVIKYVDTNGNTLRVTHSELKERFQKQSLQPSEEFRRSAHFQTETVNDSLLEKKGVNPSNLTHQQMTDVLKQYSKSRTSKFLGNAPQYRPESFLSRKDYIDLKNEAAEEKSKETAVDEQSRIDQLKAGVQGANINKALQQKTKPNRRRQQVIEEEEEDEQESMGYTRRSRQRRVIKQ